MWLILAAGAVLAMAVASQAPAPLALWIGWLASGLGAAALIWALLSRVRRGLPLVACWVQVAGWVWVCGATLFTAVAASLSPAGTWPAVFVAAVAITVLAGVASNARRQRHARESADRRRARTVARYRAAQALSSGSLPTGRGE